MCGKVVVRTTLLNSGVNLLWCCLLCYFIHRFAGKYLATHLTNRVIRIEATRNATAADFFSNSMYNHCRSLKTTILPHKFLPVTCKTRTSCTHSNHLEAAFESLACAHFRLVTGCASGKRIASQRGQAVKQRINSCVCVCYRYKCC